MSDSTCRPQWYTKAMACSPSGKEALLLQNHLGSVIFRVLGYRFGKWTCLFTITGLSQAEKAFASLAKHLRLQVQSLEVNWAGYGAVPPSGCDASAVLCTANVKYCPVCQGICTCCG